MEKTAENRQAHLEKTTLARRIWARERAKTKHKTRTTTRHNYSLQIALSPDDVLFLLLPELLVAAARVRILVSDACFDEGSSVEFAATNVPVSCCAGEDEAEEDNSIVHVLGGDRHNGREEEDYADEEGPGTSPDVDEETKFAHVPWAWFEFAKYDFAEDWNAVAPVEADGADVEYTKNGNIRSESDQVDGNAPED